MSVLLFLLWLILCGRVTAEILIFGVGLSALLLYFMIAVTGWTLQKEQKLLRMVPFFVVYFFNLLWETMKAAAAVLLVALNPSLHPEPVLVEFRSGLTREFLNVILANSITLTPGTITVFQERDRFLIHALRREYAEGLESSSFVRLLKKCP